MSEVNLSELFQQGVEKGLNKNALIMSLVTEGGVEVTRAVREYNKFARESGLVPSQKERTQRVAELLNEVDPETLKESEVRRGYAEQIMEDFDVSYATATAMVRKYCEEAKIEIPSPQRNSVEELVKFVGEMIEQKATRDDIIKGLQDQLGYTLNSANSAYSRATRELGISVGGNGKKAELSEVVALIRANANKSRKDIATLIATTFGYSETSAGAFCTYIPFAQEWTRQEIAALELA